MLSISLAFGLFITLVASTRECSQCVPLEQLTAYSHGISISNHGVDVSIAYHNGTGKSVAHVPPTKGYLAMLSRFEWDSDGHSVEDPWETWAKYKEQHPLKYHVLNGGWTSWPFRWFARHRSTSTSQLTDSYTDETSEFMKIFRTLQHDLSQAGQPMKHIGVSLPPYMTDSQTLHIFIAASDLHLDIQEIAHAPAAVATNQGADLCLVPSEYLPCDPKHIMTIDLAKDGLTLEALRIRSSGFYYWQQRAYGINHGIRTDSSFYDSPLESTKEYIDSWAAEEERARGPITKVYLIGPEADNEHLRREVNGSIIGDRVQEIHGGIDTKFLVAEGMARLTKQAMEDQVTDCLEAPQCEDLRREADRLAGRPRRGLRSELR